MTPMRTESRLKPPKGLPRDAGEAGPLNFRRVGGRVLVTNEWGFFALLEPAAFADFLGGRLDPAGALHAELRTKGFLRAGLDFPGLARATAVKQLLAWPGPNVHTVVVTLRCNLKCLYCHASVVGLGDVAKDMTLETARKTVDFIFSTPNPELMIEFQGGEPLLNWPVVRFVTEYARARAAREGRKLHIALISNFTLLDEDRADFLAGQGVSFCTSLDGPAALHDRNRIHLGGSTHAVVTAWIRRLQQRHAGGRLRDKPNAIATITRFSLDSPEAIVDQAVELGLERIQLGPLDPIGFAKRSWETIGYGPEEFRRFYARALDRVLEHNRRGKRVYEKMALIFLIRILERGHWRFPNMDGLCRLAYNHDGGIYVSEEGRLLANEGDPFFRLGAVGETRFNQVLAHPALKAVRLAAQTDAQPLCSQCAHAPYCTVVPVQNYQTQGTVWGRMPSNHWCESLMGIFDLLFERMQDPPTRAIFESWVADFRDR